MSLEFYGLAWNYLVLKVLQDAFTYRKQQPYSVSFVSWPAAELGLTLGSKKVCFVLYILLTIVPALIKIKRSVGLHESTKFRGRMLTFHSYESSRQTVYTFR